MPMRRILLLNGPNLDMLGMREPEVYGRETLASLETMAAAYAQRRGVELTCFQSNSESSLINEIHHVTGRFDGIVYNPGAHTHYSYALRDAIASVDAPVVEVHISDVDAREPFRRKSVIAPACVAQVKGLGFEGYCRAIDILCDKTGLERLGEGFEDRFPEGGSILVAEGREVSGPTAGGSKLHSESQGIGVFPAREALNLDGDYTAQTAVGEPAGLAVENGVVQEEVSAISANHEESEEAQPAAVQPDFSGDAQPSCALAAGNNALANGESVASDRQELVRNACKRAGVDALLVRDTANIRWITAIDGVFDEERAHALLVGRDKCALHTDSRYSNAVRSALRHMGSDVSVDDAHVSHAQFAKLEMDAAAEEKDASRLLGMEDSVTYAEFVKMVEAFGTDALVATTDLVLGLRAVKDAGEIQRLRLAQAITDAAFEHIVGFMRPGMTEREVQLELENYLLRHGAEALAFSSIVATGENGADPHAIPGDARLEAGQCVVMDFGAKARGYCSDMTRTVFLGQPSERMAQAWDVLRQANEAVEDMLRPGVTGKQAHELAESVLAQGGFEGKMGHGLGHGVGLEVHELPVLNMRNEQPLVEGNVVTVEPGIYLPGEFGMRLEDCGVITENGYEPFSRIGHDMVVI